MGLVIDQSLYFDVTKFREVFIRDFYGANTLLKDVVTVHDNVRTEGLLVTGNVGGKVTAYGCTPSQLAAVSLDSVTLKTCKKEFSLAFCNELLEGLYDRFGIFELTAGTPAQPNPELMSLFQSLIEQKGWEDKEKIIWLSNSTYGTNPDPDEPDLNCFDGFLTLIDAQVTATVTATTLTETNFLDEIKKVITAMNQATKRKQGAKDNLVLFVPPDVIDFIEYKTAEQGVNFDWFRTDGQGNHRVFGYRVSDSFALPDNTMVFAPKTDMHVGTNLSSEFTSFRVYPKDNAMRETVVEHIFTLGTAITNPENFVYYRP